MGAPPSIKKGGVPICLKQMGTPPFLSINSKRALDASAQSQPAGMMVSISKKATPYGAVFSVQGLPLTDGPLFTAAEDQVIHILGLDTNILHALGPPFL